jgi:ribosomal protein S18 acetylase RimI-like enzyme
VIRPATLKDVPALLDIETNCFGTDLISRQSFRHLLTAGSAAALVETAGGGTRGYALVLFRRSSRVARLYSIAVAPSHRRQGVGRRLLRAAADLARRRGAELMRLEIRRGDRAARLLYERDGFLAFGAYPGFYEDGTDAVRMERRLTARSASSPIRRKGRSGS